MRKRQDGFTLLELLIVIAIIGILAAVLVPNLIQARTRANERASQTYIYQVVAGVEARRDTVSQMLPAVGTQCWTLVNISDNPNSVKRCKYEPNVAAQSYTVTAETVSGTIFRFNGSSIVVTATY